MQHISTKGGGILQLDEDDWKAGLAVGANFSNNIIGKTRGSAVSANIDLFRQRGFIQPGVFPTTATNNSELAGAVVATQLYSDGNTLYGIDAGGKIQKYTITTSTLTTSFHTIAGTAPIGQDCIIYRHNSGGTAEANKLYSLFFSYYNNANWDVGAYVSLASSPAFDDDFMSSIPATPLDITSGDGDDAIQRIAPHPMCIGSDDILYIGSGRYLHAYDGSLGNNGTFQRAVLTFPAGFIITGIMKDDDNLLISGNYTAGVSGGSFSSSQALTYVWNYNDLDAFKVIELNDSAVHSIFRWRGVPCVITSGAESLRGAYRLKQLVGDTAVKLTDIGSLGAPGFRTLDSSTSTLYINCVGNIITVGDPMSDTGFQVNNLTSTNGATQSGTSGFVLLLSSGVLLASGGSTSLFVKFDASGFCTAGYRSMFFEPPFPVGFRGRIKKVVPIFKSTVTSQASKNFIISLWTDFSSTDQIVMNEIVLAAPLVKQFYTLANGGAFPEFQNISLRLLWQNGSASWVDQFVVSKILIYYEDVELLANS